MTPSPPRPARPTSQVFQRHNETCNIWTHLVGLAIFVAITCSMAFDWGRHRLPRLPDTWTFGDESFDATRRAIYGHLRDFANAAEDTRRALVDATDALRRATIGSSSGGRGWMESNAKNVRDAVSSMTAGRDAPSRASSAERRQRGRAEADPGRSGECHASRGARAGTRRRRGIERQALTRRCVYCISSLLPSGLRAELDAAPALIATRRMSASTSRPRRGGRCTRSSPGRSRASG